MKRGRPDDCLYESVRIGLNIEELLDCLLACREWNVTYEVWLAWSGDS